MQVRQISIFMENRAGRLKEITGVLAKAGVNIRALSLADTSDFGILRLIVDKPDHAVDVLHKEGFTIRENTVIACEVEDKPGGLHKILKLLADGGISVEYMYGQGHHDHSRRGHGKGHPAVARRRHRPGQGRDSLHTLRDPYEKLEEELSCRSGMNKRRPCPAKSFGNCSW